MKDCGSLQRAQKGRETRPFCALDGFNEIRLTLLERMAGTTRLELATSAVTANGVGGHLLIPHGTGCHFLSSPYCTRIVLCPLARLLSAFLTFLPVGILF